MFYRWDGSGKTGSPEDPIIGEMTPSFGTSGDSGVATAAAGLPLWCGVSAAC
jgi:hypothetical protein